MRLGRDRRLFEVLLAVGVASIGGCRRSTAVQTLDDAGLADTSDRISAECASETWPPEDGGVVWQTVGPATVTALPQALWQRVSKAPECAEIAPRDPPPLHSWTGPDATRQLPACDPPTVDGQGNLAVFFGSEAGLGNAFFRADGSNGAVVMNGSNECQSGAAPLSNGFSILTHPFTQLRCQFLRTFDGNATWGPTIPMASDPDVVNALIPNPRGGYVQQRLINHENPDMSDARSTLQLRWLDSTLIPIGGWQSVITVSGLGQHEYHRVVIDQRGNALALSFIYPISFGAPPPPSSWTFSARWMGPEGPLTDAFDPLVPTYTSPTGTMLFPNWGTILPLDAGGFAMFQVPAPAASGGTISLTGWYAYYPSGQPPTVWAPSWLTQYDGPLQLIAPGRIYASTRRDPRTCARVISLIAKSGETCFTLPVSGSDMCDARDALMPDGTLVLQDNCQLSWWPQLARPAK